MLSRVLEWYRIVNVQPGHDTLSRRTAAATALVDTLSGARDWESLFGTAAGVVAGFENGHTTDSTHVGQIVSALRAEDPTVPQDLGENALELRAIGAIALGELMARNPDKPADETAVMTAMLIQSGTGLRARPDEKHLARVLDELITLAQRVLNGAHQQRRRRSAFAAVKKLPTFADGQGDAMANVKTLATAVKTALNEFSQQAAIDREELDILWWLYGATSSTTGVPLLEMAPGQAAITCGVELANLCLLPPLLNADAFVREAMGKVKKADSKRAIEKIMTETDSAAWPLLTTNPPDDVGNDYPTLFPLTWLCGRLTSSKGAIGWAAEFTDKTGIDAACSLKAVELAMQVFRERIAQRQYVSAE